MSHPDKIRLIAELEESSINQYAPFSDQSEDMIHSSRNVEGFELCQLSDRIQCTHRMRYSMRGMVYCDRGSCLIPSERVRRLNKERFEVLTIPFFSIKKKEHTEGAVVVVQSGKSYTTKPNWLQEKAKTKNFSFIQDRILNQESYRESQMAIGWTEETTDALAAENHSYVVNESDTTILGE